MKMFTTKSAPVLLLLFAMLSLLQTTRANFDLYRVDETHYPPNKRHARDVADNSTFAGNTTIMNWSDTHWSAVPASPSCVDLLNAYWQKEEDDVSGNKLGVRCHGDGCESDHDTKNIKLVEMHFTNKPLLHWTIYSDQKDENGLWVMWGIDGNSYGACEPKGQSGVDFYCHDKPVGMGSTLTLYAHLKFRCHTGWLDTDINGGI